MILNWPSANPGSTRIIFQGSQTTSQTVEILREPTSQRRSLLPQNPRGLRQLDTTGPASPKGSSTRTLHLPARGRGTRLGLLQVSQDV